MAIVTSKLAKVVAVEIAKRAPFMKVGAKDYFSEQINGNMKAGREYTFVIPDAGNVVSIAQNQANSNPDLKAAPRAIDEKSISLEIQGYNNSVETNALEGITDLKWEEEIADQYAQKLINAILNDNVGSALSKASTAFIGSGFEPIALAGAQVQSITTDEVVGFIDPMAQAVLAANGQQFVPAGNPNDLYSKGHLGVFQGVDYTSERFIKPIVVSSSVITALTGATATLDKVAKTLTITLSQSATLPKGTPLMVEGLYACDTVGDATGSLYSFILDEDKTGASIVLDLDDMKVILDDVGGRMVAGEATNAPVISFSEAGTYRRAIVHATGAKCFSPVNKLDFKWSEKYSEGSVDGLNVMVNQFSDGLNGKNMTRWDMCFLAGIVEPRAVSIAYFKSGRN